ncbi:MAG: endonuclease/exonuclease/phosphatase family protein [Pirellulales bacterium]
MLTRRLPIYPMLITVLVSVAGYLGCDPQQVEQAVETAARTGQLPPALTNGMQNYGTGAYSQQAGWGGYANQGYPNSQFQNNQYPNQPASHQQYGNQQYPNPQYQNQQYGGQVAQNYQQPNYGAPNYGAQNYPASYSSGRPVDPNLPQLAAGAIPQRTASTLIVGSFNMERLGDKKLAKQQVMQQIATIVRCYDVLAIQEVTSQDPNTLRNLLRYVNANGARYDYVISSRIGRQASGYYEQYAFVFDTTRIAAAKDRAFVVSDPQDMMHREPFVCRFQAIQSGGQPFSFTLVNVHTDPDEIRTELDVLASVLVNVAQYESPEDDVMLLGDLNADPAHFQQLGRLPNILPTIQGMPTNTRLTKTLDNILISTLTTTEFTGRSGFLNTAAAFQTNLAGAEEISDHQPIWAEFRIQESVGNPTAGIPPTGIYR